MTLEGRAGAGVILAVTRGPAVAFCTLAHIRGPGCYTFPMVAAVGRGQDEKGEGRERAAEAFSVHRSRGPGSERGAQSCGA